MRGKERKIGITSRQRFADSEHLIRSKTETQL